MLVTVDELEYWFEVSKPDVVQAVAALHSTQVYTGHKRIKM